MAAVCDPSGCAEPQRLEVGWGVLRSWPSDLLQTSEGETVIGSGYWSQFQCQQFIDLTWVSELNGSLAGTTTSFADVGAYFDLASGAGIVALVYDNGVYDNGAGGLVITEVSPTTPGMPPQADCR